MSYVKTILFFTINIFSHAIFSDSIKFVVNTPVANLRYQPQAHDINTKLPMSDVDNPLQITQLLFGEHFIAQEKFYDNQNQLWYFGNTMQQEFFQESLGWHGFPGWIQAKDLLEVTDFLDHNLVVNQTFADIYNEDHQKIMTVMLGTRFCAIEKINQNYKILLPNQTTAYIKIDDVYQIHQQVQETLEQLQSTIIAIAKKFIGNWYSWGGRTPQNDFFEVSSVDCSALMQLSFLACGLQIPRMSHEQFLRAEKIQNCADLQPGDFIYFISITKHSARMDHVMMYLGNDQILESTYADDHKVRIVSFQDRMGKSCNIIQDGDLIIWNDEEFFVYFGSLLHNQNFIQNLRNHALMYDY